MSHAPRTHTSHRSSAIDIDDDVDSDDDEWTHPSQRRSSHEIEVEKQQNILDDAWIHWGKRVKQMRERVDQEQMRWKERQQQQQQQQQQNGWSEEQQSGADVWTRLNSTRSTRQPSPPTGQSPSGMSPTASPPCSRPISAPRHRDRQRLARDIRAAELERLMNEATRQMSEQRERTKAQEEEEEEQRQRQAEEMKAAASAKRVRMAQEKARWTLKAAQLAVMAQRDAQREQRWTTFETRFASSSSSSILIRVSDIPFPSSLSDMLPSSLTPSQRKQTLRNLWKRWHPDRFALSWSTRLHPDDAVKVMERVTAVSQMLADATDE